MTEPTKDFRLAILGLGKLGGILLRAFLDKKLVAREQVRATVRHAANAQARADEFEVTTSTDNATAAGEADIVLLAVKPPSVREVCEEIAPVVDESKLIISAAAAVPTSLIEETLGEVPVVRAMPNTPAVIGCGMTGICSGRYARSEHVELTQRLFDTIGRTVILDEKHMDAVTGLSASGPAFVYVILESLAEAGVKVGLPRDVATLLAAQTTHGAARMVLDSGRHPALLKDEVTTPAGCTIDGILELEEGKIRVTLIKAVVKATERARSLLLTE